MPCRPQLWFASAVIACALGPSGLVAQEAAPSAPSAPSEIEATPAAKATPTPAKLPKDKHHLQIEIGGSSLDPALRDKLSPDQLVQLELAKHQRGSMWSDLEDVVVPLAFFLMIFGIVAVGMWSRTRQRRLMHETVRLLVEKGQPVPPELFMPPDRPRSGLRGGLSSIGLGIGLILFFLNVERHLWGIGCIPLFLGLGQLLAWKIEQPKPGANPPAT